MTLGNAAAEVASNIATSAVERLGAAESVTWPDILALQGELLPKLSLRGTRDRQTWVAGGNIHPGQAKFVPPSPADLMEAVQAMVEFMNGAATGPLIQDALVHAQFETLRPSFTPCWSAVA